MALALNFPKRSTVIYGLVLTAILLVLCIMAPHYLSLLGRQQIALPVQFFISRLFFWLLLIIVYLYVDNLEKQPFLLWTEKEYTLKQNLIFIGIIILLIIAGSAIINATAYFLHLNRRSDVQAAIMLYNRPLKIFTALTAGVVEELIFRGYLMPRLQLFFKKAHWPIIISTLIFGLGHVRYGTIVNVAGPLLIGGVFAWHYNKYRNLRILIICHFMIDFVALMFGH
jgi:membrane protease YdiL (CAAX protease family)